MDFATWSIRRPVPAILLFLLLSVAGLLGFHALPVANMPDIDLPAVRITLRQPGAAPAQLETEVARKVEDSLATLTGLKHLRTAITDGSVQITAEFELERNLSDALIDTRNAVDSVRANLPADLEAPSVTSVIAGNDPILTHAVAAPKMSEEALSWYVDDTVARAVLSIPGVGRFERVGGVDREVRVEVDPVRLAAHGATAADVSRALRNTQQQSSGGKARIGGEEQSLRTIATVDQAAALATLPVVLADGRQLRLDEIASVQDSFAERSQAARLDGERVVGFRIYRARGADETAIGRELEKRLSALTSHDEVRFTQIVSTVEHTEEQFQGSMHMLYEGAILAVLVVWGFLRDWRATLIAASALPLSILPAFAAMAWLGYSLNTLTLLALAAVIGILVDDAIVEIENIERHAQMGKSPLNAAADAVREIALAVIATTLTLAVVFAPTAMMSGVPGLFFKQFGWTAVIAVLSSLLVARLLTPMMSAYFLRPAKHVAKEDGRLMSRYLDVVRWTLTHRRSALLITAAVFVASASLILLLRTGLIPQSDQGFTAVDFELAPGSTLAASEARSEALREILSPLPGIAHVFTTIGSGRSGGVGGPRAGEVRRGTLTLALKPRDARESQSAIEAAVREALRNEAGVRLSIAGGMGARLSLVLASEDSQALKQVSRELVSQLRNVGTLANVSSSADLERPELVIRPDFERAADLGVTTAAIGDTLRIATAGDFDAQLARLNLDARQINLRVKLPDSARENLDTLAALKVNARGGQVPLSSVATLTIESGPSQIDRYDRRRQTGINAELNGMALGAALQAARALPAVQQMPASVSLINTGDAEIMGELISGFVLAILLGVLCVYCVLALLFSDFILPVAILSAIPLSVGGAFLALFLARAELDVPSMIGLVMLMGIVTKNSILLVEYAVVGQRERGLPLHDAIIDACHKRARPIIMTSIAMIAGMLPIALGLGADASFRQPMAIAVIGGLVTSTLLSLVIVPVIFVCIETLEANLALRWQRRSARPALPANPQ